MSEEGIKKKGLIEIAWTKKHLKRWSIGFAVIFAIILLQQFIGNAYEPFANKAWIWLAVVNLPLFIFLVQKMEYKAFVHNPIDELIHRGIGFYYILVVASVVLRPLTHFSPIDALQNAYFYLIPLELILIILLLRNPFVLKISAKIPDLPTKREKLKKDLRNLLGKSEIGEVIENLKKYYYNRNEKRYNDMISMEGRWNKLQGDFHMKRITKEDADVETTKITQALLAVISDI